MEAPTRNKELFYKIAEVIEKDDSVYDQAVWGGVVYQSCADDPLSIESAKTQVKERACGTAHCIAGHAAVLSGWTPYIRVGYNPTTEPLARVVEVNWEEMLPPEPTEDEYAYRHPSEIARTALGLSIRESEILFSEYWRPEGWKMSEGMDEGLSNHNRQVVAQALRDLGDGDSIWDVTYDDSADRETY